MREIKFRACDNIDLKWWDNLAVANALLLSQQVEPNVYLMQYTGLKDKKGVEIYEGDIVTWRVDATVHTKAVEWIEKDAGFKPNDLTSEPVAEVIGNIHETPELLKETA